LYERVKSPKLRPVFKNLAYPKSVLPNYLLSFSRVLYCHEDKHNACLKLKSAKSFVRICRHFENSAKFALKRSPPPSFKEIERQRRSYGNTVSLASLKKYFCVKTPFSMTATTVATGVIMWKPGLSFSFSSYVK